MTDRGNWNNQCEFILTCVGLAVGLGNVWRFPYLCYKNGGGAFLIPYFLSMLFLGIPLFYLELILGQYGGLGPIKIWRASPAFKGLGVAMTMTSFIISLYYNVVVAYCFYYFFSSMAAQLPWTTCDKTWNTCYCRDGNQNESLADPWAGTRPECVNFTYSKNLTSPYEEYFNIRVLGLTSGLGEAGNVKWDLCLCLLLAWLVVFLVLSKGVQSLGKVVYFSALFPYFLLTALLIRGVTLEGYYEGIYYYITPDFSKLKEASVWSDAAVQIFFSLSTCQGSLVALGSYNKFNNNVLRDTFLVPIINCLTSFYAGFSIFAVLGFMAHKKNVDVQDVATDGPGLTFLVYPEGLAQMPIAPLWSILFFFMMLTLGFSSQFSIVETVLTGIQDTYVSKFKSTRWTVVFRFAVCMTGFLLGLPMVTEGGHYLFTIVDNFIGGFPVLFIGLFEIIVIMYVYGFRKFKRDIESMIGINIAVRISHYFFVPLWLCFSPVMLLVIIFVKAYQFNGLKLDDYVFPNWGLTIGWFIVIGALIWIPLFFVLRAIQHGLCKFCKEMNSPKHSWKPNVKDGDTFYGDNFPSVENNAEKQFSHTDFNAGVGQNVIENGKSQHQYDNSAFDGQRM